MKEDLLHVLRRRPGGAMQRKSCRAYLIVTWCVSFSPSVMVSDWKPSSFSRYGSWKSGTTVRISPANTSPLVGSNPGGPGRLPTCVVRIFIHEAYTRARSVAEQYGAAEAMTDAQAAVARSDVDAVIVALVVWVLSGVWM